VTLPEPTDGADPAWHLYVVRTRERATVMQRLAAAEIECRTYYSTPVHRQPAMAHLASGVPLPGTAEAAQTHLAIPMHPSLTREDVRRVVAATGSG
jgi:dTDP-4-amino-4,6-dideoxygalactose transaminase